MKKIKSKSVSLAAQMAAGAILLLIMTVCISTLLYLREARRLSEKTENVNMGRELLTYQAVFESYIERADECSRMICNSDALQSALSDAAHFVSEKPTASLDSTLIRQLTGNSVISSVYVFDTRGNMYRADEDFAKQPAMKDIWSAPWYNDVYELQGDWILKINAGGFFEDQQEQGDYISLIRSVMEYGTENEIGTLIVNISLQTLQEEFEKNAAEMEMKVVICDEYNNIAFSTGDVSGAPIQQYLRDYVIYGNNYQTYQGTDGIRYKVCCRKYENSGWRMLGIVEQNPYTETVRQFGKIAAVVLVMACFLLLIGMGIFRNILFKALNPILESIHKIPDGVFESVEPAASSRELYELQTGYNRMTEQIQALFQKVEEEQQEKRKYELNVLQAQIKPHFLYNTFDSISALILTKRDRDAFQMLQALGKYYRTSLHKGDEVITLAEELKIVQNYLIIQQYRYEDIVHVEYDLDEHISDCKVLKLIMQPFVENAIYHGLKVKEDGGTIRIRTSDEQDMMKIVIADDGVGMTEERLKEVMEDQDHQEKVSFGVRGTIERIRLYYKREDLVTIQSKVDEGTCVTIRIPKNV